MRLKQRLLPRIPTTDLHKKSLQHEPNDFSSSSFIPQRKSIQEENTIGDNHVE